MVFAVAADVFGKQVLRIGMLARAHAQHQKRRVFCQVFRNAIRYDLKFGTEDTDLFQHLRVLPQRQRFVRGFANSAPAGPRDVGRDQADVANDGQVVVTQQFLDVVGRRAIVGVATDTRIVECRAQIVFACCDGTAFKPAPATVGKTDLNETIASRFAHLCIKELAFD